MSQWGKLLKTEKYDFLPHVDGATFSPLTEADLVDDVVCIRSRLSWVETTRLLEECKCKYVGKPYSLWLEQFETGETV